MSKESDQLLWLALKSELGATKALDFISDMKELGVDLKSNTEWCVNNRQLVFQAIVGWQFGLIETINKIKKEIE